MSDTKEVSFFLYKFYFLQAVMLLLVITSSQCYANNISTSFFMLSPNFSLRVSLSHDTSGQLTKSARFKTRKD